jgi:competence ComEA-like helix-hairpin-helix protein
MNAFRKVREYFVFTRSEQKILFMLSMVFCIGAGIKAYRTMTDAPAERSFDYTLSDSVFAARSAAVPASRPDSTRARTDLNTATRAQLIALPGIGPKLADRMIAYRSAHRKFRTINEVRKIAGIGAKKFELLRSTIEVKPDTGR